MLPGSPAEIKPASSPAAVRPRPPDPRSSWGRTCNFGSYPSPTQADTGRLSCPAQVQRARAVGRQHGTTAVHPACPSAEKAKKRRTAVRRSGRRLTVRPMVTTEQLIGSRLH
jgi:hypothetical protein